MAKGKLGFWAGLSLLGLAAVFATGGPAAAQTTSPEAAGGDDNIGPEGATNVAVIVDLGVPSATLSWDLSPSDFFRQVPAGNDPTSGGTFSNTNDVTYYRILRSELGGDFEEIDMVPAGTDTYEDLTVLGGTTYTYQVVATDGTNDAPGADSGPAVLGPPPVAEITVPSTINLGTNGPDETASSTISAANNATEEDALLAVRFAVEGAGFSVTQDVLTLAPGESGSVDVLFEAALVGNINGTYTGVLTITTNDPDNREQVIDLTARITGGVQPVFRPGVEIIVVGPDGEIIRGDLNGDGANTLDDFFQLADAFGSAVGDENYNPAADIDGDGDVDLSDFFAYADDFGKAGTLVALFTAEAELSGAQEVPPVETEATGLGRFVLNQAEDVLTYTVDVSGLADITAAHIHAGVAGENGGPVRDLEFAPTTAGSARASGEWRMDDAEQPLTAELVEALKAGGLYVNVHSSANPPGEIRGQILELTDDE